MEGLRYEAIPHSTDANSIIGGCRKVRGGGRLCGSLPATPSGGRDIKRITVAVRLMVNGSASSKIWSRATSEFDQSNPPQ